MAQSKEQLDYINPIECDVVVAGADMAGLVAGAILARKGKKVIVVDGPPQIGGRGGSTHYQGYWLDCGHREGLDVTDLEIGWIYGQEAVKEAGVEFRLSVVDNPLRIHLLPELPPRKESSTVVDGGDWTPEAFANMARQVFGVSEEKMPEFEAVLNEKIAGASPEERERNVPVTLAEWLPKNVQSEEVRNAILTMAKTIYCQYPERASTGRIMGFFASRKAGTTMLTGFADDDEAGGMQGAHTPFARGIREHGGEIILNHKPVEVVFEGSRAVGLVAVSESHHALEIRAQHTIISSPIWNALSLIPPQHVDSELEEISQQLQDSGTDGVGWQVGLKRMPTIRSTGETENYRGWNRLFVGPDKAFRGGFHFPSLSSRRAAPEGRELLHCLITRWLKRGERPSWPETRATIAGARDYLHQYYADLDDCIEWEAFQWMTRPGMMGWFWAPVRRHGIRYPNCEGLYFANTTIESDAGPVDISAHAGLLVAQAIMGE